MAVFLRLARFVERHARSILVVEVLFTAVMVMAIVQIGFRFESDLSKFMPESEESSAYDRLQGDFGRDPSAYFIHIVPEGNDSVMAPAAFREQLRITRAIEESGLTRGTQPKVTGHVSFALFFELYYGVLREETDPEDPADLTDGELSEWLDDLLSYLTSENYEGHVQVWEGLQDYADTDDCPPSSRRTIRKLTPEDLMLIDDSILHKDSERVGGRWIVPSTLMVVYINGTLDPPERKAAAIEIHEDVLGAMDVEHIRLRETGADLLGYEIDRMTMVSNYILGVGILLVILATLYFTFRDWSDVLRPMASMILTVIWTMGSCLALGTVFTAIHVAVIPLIVGLGIDYSVHMMTRFNSEMRACGDTSRAMTNAIEHVGVALFLTAITTVFSFMSNIPSSVQPVRDFGIICGLGILYALVLTLTFQPALRYAFGGRGPSATTVPGGITARLDETMGRGGRAALRQRRAVVAVVLLMTAASLWGATQVRTEFRLEDFLPEGWEVVKTYEDIATSYDAASQSRVYIYIEGEDLATVDTVWALHSLEDEIVTEDPARRDDRLVRIPADSTTWGEFNINRSYSILNYMRIALRYEAGLAERFHFRKDATPAPGCTDGDVAALFEYMLVNDTYKWNGRTVLHGFNESGVWTFDDAVFRMYVNAGSETDRAREVFRDLDDDIGRSAFPDPRPRATKAGYVISTIRTIEAIQASQVQSTIISTILCALIVMIIYRSIILGLLATMPVVFTSVWIVGTMTLTENLHAAYWSGMPDISLNVMTVSVTALSIGLGIDYSIHVIARFSEERRHADVDTAIVSAIRNTGTALLISMLTTVLGFAVLLFSPMPLTQHFGFITSVTMVYAFLLCVFFMPVFLSTWAKRAGDARPGIDEFKALLGRQYVSSKRALIPGKDGASAPAPEPPREDGGKGGGSSGEGGACEGPMDEGDGVGIVIVEE